MPSDFAPWAELLRFKSSHGVDHGVSLGAIRFFPLQLLDPVSTLCAIRGRFCFCIQIRVHLWWLPGALHWKERWGQVQIRQDGSLWLITGICKSVPSTDVTATPTCKEAMLNASRAVLSTKKQDLVTPGASELKSSLLPRLHIASYISIYIYRTAIVFWICTLTQELIYLKEYFNVFKELSIFKFWLFLMLLHCNPKMWYVKFLPF